ncbi:MAG TPA: hypothetical protein VMA74_14585 [Dyella sp.]|uniref:hypothetical protein n=1 Tax=Dyella sp. TaxID=1869338 RepID=UPI002BCC9A0A|nr:hypothetical protein [Dyella sp.]HUB90949.1 hypothetical protein [Dyella sp.]
MREFNDFGEFAAFLLSMEPVAKVAVHRGLEKGLKRIETTAKESIGTYQDAIGQFPAWDELADSTKKDRVRQGYSENDPLLRSGETRDSIQSEIHDMEGVVASESDILYWQEVGTEDIPPRPVMGPAALVNEEHVVRDLGEAYAIAWLGGVVLPIGIGQESNEKSE